MVMGWRRDSAGGSDPHLASACPLSGSPPHHQEENLGEEPRRLATRNRLKPTCSPTGGNRRAGTPRTAITLGAIALIAAAQVGMAGPVYPKANRRLRPQGGTAAQRYVEIPNQFTERDSADAVICA